jgi:type VII secretion-associated serine protease mycosin
VGKVRTIGIGVVVALGASGFAQAHAAEAAAPTVRQGPRARASASTEPVIAGELAVRFRRGVSSTTKHAAAAKVGAHDAQPIAGTDFARVQPAPNETRATATARLKSDPNVEDVVPVYKRHASAMPTDPILADQLQYLTPQNLAQAWPVSTGNGVIIAVVDTGVDATHPDLTGRVLPGWDFVNNDSNAADDEGHGTAVAGVAAAKANNGGMVGIAYDARILPVKVLDNTGSGSDTDIANGIAWAADHGAKVINLSLGGFGGSPIIDSAVAYAMSRDALVVAATGNEGTNEPSFPASSPGVVGVGATNGHNSLTFFSNWGSQVDVAAPGWDVIAPDMATHGYVYGSGTSFSAPIVSATAALVRSLFPTLSATATAARLKDTANEAGPPGDDDKFGGGIVDAWAAEGGTAWPVSSPNYDREAGPDTARVVSGSVTDTIAIEGDTDWFAYDAPAQGAVTMTVQPTDAGSAHNPLFDGEAFDGVIEGFSSEFKAIGTADNNGGPFTGEQLVVPTAAAGRVYARVSNWFPSAWHDGYSITATFAPGAVSVPAGGAQLATRAITPEDSAEVSVPTPMTVRLTTAVLASSVPGAVSLVRGDDGAMVPVTTTLTAADTLRVVPVGAQLRIAPYLLRMVGLKTSTGATIAPVSTRFAVSAPSVYTPFASARAVVSQQFTDILAKDPVTAAVDYMSNLTSGFGPERIDDAFFSTGDFATVIAPITRLYIAYFNRAPDYGGLRDWATKLRTGWPLSSVSDAFARSDEFTKRYGSLSNAGFVDLVYRNVLKRAPDAAGLASWVATLDTGAMNRGTVMLGFSESAEFKGMSARRVDMSVIYAGILRRQPTYAEMIGYLASGMSRVSLLLRVVHTRQYRDRFGV